MSPAGQVVRYSEAGPGKPANEDSVAVIPVSDIALVIAVADGVGGAPDGAGASREVVETLARAILEREDEVSLRTAVLDAIEAANRTILAWGTGAATTVAAVAIEGTTIRPFHVGDSLILVTGQRGKVKFQNVPHSPTGYAVEAGVLDDADAVHHAERNIVSNVVGDPDMRIEIGPSIDLAQRDTLVVASDGLADNLYREEIVELVRTGDLAKSGETLAARARARMVEPERGKPHHPDDLSFVLFRPPGKPAGRGTDDRLRTV